jgi:hypothetical protein
MGAVKRVKAMHDAVWVPAFVVPIHLHIGFALAGVTRESDIAVKVTSKTSRPRMSSDLVLTVGVAALHA